jgi:acyl-CoA synthetase (AMP-forming)/AMP-acid ligase II
VSCTAGRYTSKLKLFGCLLNPSYRDPEATAAAFRNGFFLTGDLGWMDADGYLWFVARKKDVIRRRGENISGAEIDLVAGDHPEVVEAAAIGVPAELGEDEVLLAVVKKNGQHVNRARDQGLSRAGRKAKRIAPSCGASGPPVERALRRISSIVRALFSAVGEFGEA